MSENSDPTSSEEEGFVNLRIPAELADQVLAYLSQLTDSEGEVTAHAFNIGGVIHSGEPGGTIPTTQSRTETIFDPPVPPTSGNRHDIAL